jgi:hypothetical protein
VVSFTFVVVASCWSSSGDVELSMLLLPHTRTHLQHKKKKKKNCTYHSNGCRNEAVRYKPGIGMCTRTGMDMGIGIVIVRERYQGQLHE